jgi:lipid-binding SYLF domain-containing protein
MKFLKYLSGFAAVTLAGFAVSASGDENRVTYRDNGHGQMIVQYRPAQPTTVALFRSGQGATATTAREQRAEAPVPTIQANAHGQQQVLFRSAD